MLVIELCTEGSLHTHLREPPNSRGVRDSEFLLLLRDLSSALYYLHVNNYVHRDIKPGNILRFRHVDGEFTYKLSDFGASRHLDNGDMFMSLAGTEEYLHPRVYEKAFVDRNAVVCFDSSVDAWSTGCTYYQSVTGLIPFRPHGGVRNNRGTMFTMIAEKPDGVISGHQQSNNGQITWEKHLPDSCQLSWPMKMLVRNLISRLLEKEQTILMSRDQYQKHVQVILQMVRIVIFNTIEMIFVIIYIKPNCSLAEFQDQVAGRSDIMAGDQLLYHRGRKLSDLTTDGTTFNKLPCDHTAPIILLSRCQTDICPKELQLLESPLSFHQTVNVEEDCKTSHKMAVFVCDVKDRITMLVRLQESSEQACNCMILHLDKQHSYLEKTASVIGVRLQEVRARQELMEDQEVRRVKVTKERNSIITQKCRSVGSAMPKLQEELKKVVSRLSEYKMTTQLLELPRNTDVRCSGKCITRAESLANKGTETWREMHNRKQLQPLSEREQLCHTRDRRRMVEITTSAESLLQDHCQQNWNRILLLVKQRLQQFHSLDKGQSVLLKKVAKLREYVDGLEETLVQTNAFIGRAWSEFTLKFQLLKFELISIPEVSQRELKESRKRIHSLETVMNSLPNVEVYQDKFFIEDNG